MKVSLFTQKIKKLSLAILLIAVLVSLPLFPLLVKNVNADNMVSRKVTISDSRATLTNVTYDFAFTASVDTAIKQWTIKFCTETLATGTCTLPTGIVTTGATRASDNVSGATRTDTFDVNGTLTTVVTTPTTQSPLPVTVSYTGITNPTTPNTTYFARITTYSDAGTTIIDGTNNVAFAILASTSIAVTATIDTTLTFTVAGVASASGVVNGATPNITTTATTIPLGLMVPNTTVIGAHDITVATNALNGYTTTVKNATSSAYALVGVVAGNKIDNFTGTDAAPAVWSTPGGTTQNSNTGFFGYTTNDATLSTGPGAANRFISNKWAGLSSTPTEVAFNSRDETVPTVTRVGWQAEINHAQPADSYSGGVILVTTPTY